MHLSLLSLSFLIAVRWMVHFLLLVHVFGYVLYFVGYERQRALFSTMAAAWLSIYPGETTPHLACWEAVYCTIAWARDDALFSVGGRSSGTHGVEAPPGINVLVERGVEGEKKREVTTGRLACGSPAFIATLLFDPSMFALPIIETQESERVGVFTRQ